MLKISIHTKFMIGALLAITVSLIGDGYGLRPATASAADARLFKAGRIIDDSVMTNYTSMSEVQIQNFLNSKVPVCDTNGTKTSEYGGPDTNGDGRVTRAEYGKSRGVPPPYTCIKNYSLNGESAARLIYQAARDYKINPKVLIVLLQKEQGLITDDWPWPVQYRSATGYGCPDTAACDSTYYGLKNQLRWAAKMYRSILNNDPNWYTPYVIGSNRIYWHPDLSRCGSSTVNIENLSTVAMYSYTPYRPNAAALNAGYGTGDSCSSYGNRNFFLYFSDWFGSPNGTPSYTYSIVSQEAFSDSAYTAKIANNLTLAPGGSAYIQIKIKNTGNQVLSKDSLRIGTMNPYDRASIFKDSSWIAANRPTAVIENAVAPGDIATFRFKIVAPTKFDTFNETFGVLIEHNRWMKGSFSYPITIQSANPYYLSDTIEFKAYKDAARTIPVNNTFSTYTGSKLYVRVKIKNVGNRNFPADTTKLATSNPNDRASAFKDESWLNIGRVKSLTSTVTPGQVGMYEFTMTTPNTAGRYIETFGQVIEGARWIENDTGSFDITVKDRPPSALQSGQRLIPGQELLSGNERYRLIFQSDGNLVLYSPNRYLWQSKTYGKKAALAILQSDGNFVIYDSAGKPIWHTRTFGKGVSRLILQSDGNSVLYSDSGHTWHTRTSGMQ